MENIFYKAKIGKWQAIVLFDEENDLYVISNDGEGGAVVSDTLLPIAEQKFIEAMNLASAVQKLMYYKQHGSFPNKK